MSLIRQNYAHRDAARRCRRQRLRANDDGGAQAFKPRARCCNFYFLPPPPSPRSARRRKDKNQLKGAPLVAARRHWRTRDLHAAAQKRANTRAARALTNIAVVVVVANYELHAA